MALGLLNDYSLQMTNSEPWWQVHLLKSAKKIHLDDATPNLVEATSAELQTQTEWIGVLF